MSADVGIMIVGLGGAIGSTVVAGVELMRQGLVPAVGMLTETETLPQDEGQPGGPLIRDALGLPALTQLRFSGWDLRATPLCEVVEREQIVFQGHQEALRGPLSQVVPLPGVVRAGDHIQVGERTCANLREACEQLRADIRAFREAAKVSMVVVVDLTSTRPWPSADPVHERLARFEEALDGKSAAITANMLYFYAACREGCPYVNFTPNLVEIDALRELALREGVPHAGRDGKTGQTLLKTVLAPSFRKRQLRVRGWFSANILGNDDGRALSDPAACQTKIASKTSVLDSILGYPVVAYNGEPGHLVSILYHPPRGDSKESWDSIDLEGFLGSRMQLKINFLCKDSILAAPLVIDLARFAAHARAAGERGPLKHLSLYFKSPLTTAGSAPVHDFFEQWGRLVRYLREARPCLSRS